MITVRNFFADLWIVFLRSLKMNQPRMPENTFVVRAVYCPRCKSPRIQRAYDDLSILLRLVGLHRLLCNNCGLEFKGFDPFGKLIRSAAVAEAHALNRRRAPRYFAHLPTAISLIEGDTQVGKVSYSLPSRGHCEVISKRGMGISCVGARFPEGELSRVGRFLFVRVDLPDASIEAVVSIVTHERVGDEGKRKWFLGVNIHQMSDVDTDRLAAYLEKRAKGQPLQISE